MYDVVVHYGAPKTGSSAIQYFLLQNRSTLEQCGYYYPPHPHDRNAVSGGHSRLGHALLDAGKQDEARGLFAEYLADARSKRLTLLLSAESLYIQPEAFRALTEGLSVKVIGFHRDPLDLILSSYNQLVKRAFMTGTLPSYCRNLLGKPVIGMTGAMHEKWADLFGDEHVSVMPYDAALFAQESIERRFLSSLSISDGNYSKFQFLDRPVNGSYSRSALALKRLLNLALDPKRSKLNDEIDRCLQHYSDHNPERRISLGELIPPDVYEALARKFRTSNDAIRARFFPDENISFLTDHDQFDHALPPFVVAGDFSISHVANAAFAGNEELIGYITECVTAYCQSTQQRGFEQFALANLAGISLNVPAANGARATFLNAKQVARLTGEKVAVPQFLRELAVAHEEVGDANTALKFIERACELRPASVPLQNIRDRIMKGQKRQPGGPAAPRLAAARKAVS